MFEDGSCLQTLAREIAVVTSGHNSIKFSLFVPFRLYSTPCALILLVPFVDTKPSWVVAAVEVIADSKSFPFLVYMFSSLAVPSLNLLRSRHPQIN